MDEMQSTGLLRGTLRQGLQTCNVDVTTVHDKGGLDRKTGEDVLDLRVGSRKNWKEIADRKTDKKETQWEN